MKKYDPKAAQKAKHRRALRAKKLPSTPQSFRILSGDCKVRLRELADNSVDSVVTDPPYELGFCGKQWDKTGVAFDVEVWREVMRVLKPGGHLFAFGGTRTYHRMTCAIEDAGFEVRDCLGWHYGSGFPKSKNISKGIDSFFGEDRKVVGKGTSWNRPDLKPGVCPMNANPNEYDLTAPATPQAEQWEGFGSALKPSFEPIVMARKPFEGSLVECVLEHDTGGINVDACRVGESGGTHNPMKGGPSVVGIYGDGLNNGRGFPIDKGRWPPNVLLTHDPSCTETECVEGCPVEEMGRQSGVSTPKPGRQGRRGGNGFGNFDDDVSAKNLGTWPADPGGTAARFFTVTSPDPPFLYTAKASKSEREAGCELLGKWWNQDRKNDHTTVKPISIMSWLVRLGTPPGGVVLDPFTGSGTTGVACALEGFSFVGIELLPQHVSIAEARINHHAREVSTATRVAVS